jgi:uncharacterized protein YeaO (DUF488 family)
VVRHYDRGDLILLEGDLGGALHYVRSGLIKVFKTSAAGKEQVLRMISAGHTFNNVPALDGGPNPASACAWLPRVSSGSVCPGNCSIAKEERVMVKHELMLAIKRVYDEPEPGDGTRVLVDRLWPRGLSKERAHVDLWLKEIAPSNELRTWFGHDPEKFAEFRRRYEAELASESGQAALTKLHDLAKHGHVTLVFAAHDTEHANAVVLRDLLLHGSR